MLVEYLEWAPDWWAYVWVGNLEDFHLGRFTFVINGGILTNLWD